MRSEACHKAFQAVTDAQVCRTTAQLAQVPQMHVSQEWLLRIASLAIQAAGMLCPYKGRPGYPMDVRQYLKVKRVGEVRRPFVCVFVLPLQFRTVSLRYRFSYLALSLSLFETPVRVKNILLIRGSFKFGGIRARPPLTFFSVLYRARMLLCCEFSSDYLLLRHSNS